MLSASLKDILCGRFVTVVFVLCVAVVDAMVAPPLQAQEPEVYQFQGTWGGGQPGEQGEQSGVSATFVSFGNGTLSNPVGTAVDASNPLNVVIYVADFSSHRIKKFDKDGGFILAWGSFGTTAGRFSSPQGVAVDSAGNVYVADTNNHRIQKFNSTGGFITQWGTLVPRSINTITYFVYRLGFLCYALLLERALECLEQARTGSSWPSMSGKN